MKKIFSLCALSIFTLTLFASEGQTALLKWQLRVPKSTSVIRYQLNGEDADSWTLIHNTEDGIIELPVETPVGQDSSIYVQQSKDGILWSESFTKLITADVVQKIYDKKNNAANEDNAQVVVPSAPSALTTEEFVTEPVTEKNDTAVASSNLKTSAFAFSFLVKPSVSVNLQKIIPVASNEHWKSYASAYNWNTTNKFAAKDLAPRLDFEFGFQNIGGKKGDVAAFDIGLNLGYEAAPYSGWTDKDSLKKFMNLDVWYHNVSLDLRFDLAFNAGVFRPYIGLGGGVMLSITNVDMVSDNLPGTPLFVLRNGRKHSDNLNINGYTYVLGALGFRFNCSSNFTIGVEGTYKLFVTGADTNHLWHSVDCALSLGGTWSV